MKVKSKLNRGLRGRRSAFTLLEILLVVGLLALLAAIAIPNLVSRSETAKKQLVKGVIGPNGAIMGAINNFKMDTGRYPESLKDLMEKPNDDSLAKKWTGPYLNDKSGLKDPWDQDYQYAAPGTHNEKSVDLWSKGPDGIDGNDDDIKNWESD